jgi:hypothetical protein
MAACVRTLVSSHLSGEKTEDWERLGALPESGGKGTETRLSPLAGPQCARVSTHPEHCAAQGSTAGSCCCLCLCLCPCTGQGPFRSGSKPQQGFGLSLGFDRVLCPGRLWRAVPGKWLLRPGSQPSLWAPPSIPLMQPPRPEPLLCPFLNGKWEAWPSEGMHGGQGADITHLPGRQEASSRGQRRVLLPPSAA